MINLPEFAYYYLKGKIILHRIYKGDTIKYSHLKHKYTGKLLLSADEVNKLIFEKIESNKPLLVGRFGATELSMMKTIDFQLKSKYSVCLNQLSKWSGFFPNNIMEAKHFVELMKTSSKDCDVLAVWFLPFEDYYIKELMNKQLYISYLFHIEPWSNPRSPWSAALKGKKVLIINPFVDTIRSQYERRDKLFLGTNILPEFELKTLKAVQTIAGQEDERFNSWFDALEYMYTEALKVDFDIAIIGCGAYGFPLASKLKQIGKQAIHLGGATQLLFGIKGRRWESGEKYEYVRKFFNDSWVYPSEEETPKNAAVVEGACYWQN